MLVTEENDLVCSNLYPVFAAVLYYQISTPMQVRSTDRACLDFDPHSMHTVSCIPCIFKRIFIRGLKLMG